MKTLKVNQEGDIELDGRMNLRMVEGVDEKVQSVRMLLSTAQGEWFLNTQHGTDYWDILGAKPDANEQQIRETIMEALEQEERVTEVLEFKTEYDGKTRKLYITLKLKMDGEPVEVAQELEVG